MTRFRELGRTFWVLTGLATLLLAHVALAQDGGDVPSDSASETGDYVAEKSRAPSAATDGELGAATEKPWLDRMRDGFSGSVDGTARWFDGFFGETQYDDTTTKTFGRASLKVAYKEYDGIIVRSRVRGRFPLPNLNHRFNAIIGKGNPDDIIEGDEDFGTLLPDEEDEWLAGLGYTPPWSRSGRISLGAGVHLDWPLDPYVQARYKFIHNFSKQSLMRVRETVFWRDSEGFGSSTNIDLERRVGDVRLLRWSNMFKVSEVIDELRYDSRVTMYQNLGNERAMSWMAGIKGETGDPAPVREYGTAVTLRERMFRPWFFGELLLGCSWVKEDDWPKREFAVFAGIGCEFFFGEPPAASTAPDV